MQGHTVSTQAGSLRVGIKGYPGLKTKPYPLTENRPQKPGSGLHLTRNPAEFLEPASRQLQAMRNGIGANRRQDMKQHVVCARIPILDLDPARPVGG